MKQVVTTCIAFLILACASLIARAEDAPAPEPDPAVNIYCPVNLPCTITGLWDFTGGLEVNGVPIGSVGGNWINVAGFGSVPDGQVANVGTVSSGSLNQVTISSCPTLATCQFVNADVGKTFYMANYQFAGPPVSTNVYTCSTSGAQNLPTCGGTGSLGSSTTNIEMYYVLTFKGSTEGQQSLEGELFIPSGATDAGIVFPGYTCPSGATSVGVYASIDPTTGPDDPVGEMSGHEVLQTQLGTGGYVACSTGFELDSMTTGTSTVPGPTMTTGTITGVSGATATLSVSFPNAVQSEWFSWGTPQDGVSGPLASAIAQLDPYRGGTLYFPSPTNGACYYMTTGLTFSSAPYVGIRGGGPASGFIPNSTTALTQGMKYEPSGTSELCTPAHINILSYVSANAPHQYHPGYTIEQLGLTDVSGVGNAKGAIYDQDVNHYTIRDVGFGFFSAPARTEGGGSYAWYGDGKVGTTQGEEQYAQVTNTTGLWMTNGYVVGTGKISQIKYSDNRMQGSQTGGGAGWVIDCNSGVNTGGTTKWDGDQAILYPIGYDICDHGAWVFEAHAENTLGAVLNVLGDTKTGTGMYVHGTGTIGASCTISVSASSGISESGTTAVVTVGSPTVPTCYGPAGAQAPPTQEYVNVTNVPINAYNGTSFPILGIGPCSTCGPGSSALTARQFSYGPLNATGLATTGHGQTTVPNTCTGWTVAGATLVNFSTALHIGPNCDNYLYSGLNFGIGLNRNNVLDYGTDRQALSNQGQVLSQTQPGQPAMIGLIGVAAIPQTSDYEDDCDNVWPQGSTCSGNLYFTKDARTDTTYMLSPNAPDYNIGGLPASSTVPYASMVACPDSSFNITFCTTTPAYGALGVITSFDSAGLPEVAEIGRANTVMDGATTLGDYVIKSTTVPGAGHDAGASPPSPAYWLGVVTQTASLRANPSSITGSFIASAGGLAAGGYYVGGTCLNVVGQETGAVTALITNPSSGASISIQPPVGCSSDSVAWNPYADHQASGAGSVVLQTVSSSFCRLASAVAGCSLTSNWGSGSIANPPGTNPPGSTAEGPTVPVFLKMVQ